MNETSMVEISDAAQTAITRGVAMLREGRFFDAHECFEESFREASGGERTLLHGLAQFAASYHQLALGRARAAVRTWDKARRKLSEVGALPHGFAHEMETFFEVIGVHAEGPRFTNLATLPSRDAWPVPEVVLPFVSAFSESTAQKKST